jgi:hypothetical protein
MARACTRLSKIGCIWDEAIHVCDRLALSRYFDTRLIGSCAAAHQNILEIWFTHAVRLKPRLWRTHTWCPRKAKVFVTGAAGRRRSSCLRDVLPVGREVH